MLPGNGTVVLETVTSICGVFKSYDINEQSSLVVSALNQVYQSVAQLIKLCDDVLIFGEKAINTENVSDILRLVELAIQVFYYAYLFCFTQIIFYRSQRVDCKQLIAGKISH